MNDNEKDSMNDLYSICDYEIQEIYYSVDSNYKSLIRASKELYKHDNVATAGDILNEVSSRLFFKSIYSNISRAEKSIKIYEDMIKHHKANLDNIKKNLYDSKLQLKFAEKMHVVPSFDDVVNAIANDINLSYICSIIREDDVIEDIDAKLLFTKQEVIEAIKKSDIDKFKSLNFEEICKILYLFKMNKEDIGNSKKKWLLEKAVSKYSFIMTRRHQGKEYKDNDKLDKERKIMECELQKLSVVSKASVNKLYEKFDSICTLAILQSC